MLAGNNFSENFKAKVPVERLKKYPQLFLMANLSISIKSNQFIGKFQDILLFEETKES